MITDPQTDAMFNPRRAIRRRDVSRLLGRANSTVSLDVNRGLLPPPAKYCRNSFWLEAEIVEILEARLRGATDDDIRAIVQRQLAERDTPAQRERRIVDRQHMTALAKASLTSAKRKRGSIAKEA